MAMGVSRPTSMVSMDSPSAFIFFLLTPYIAKVIEHASAGHGVPPMAIPWIMTPMAAIPTAIICSLVMVSLSIK